MFQKETSIDRDLNDMPSEMMLVGSSQQSDEVRDTVPSDTSVAQPAASGTMSNKTY